MSRMMRGAALLGAALAVAVSAESQVAEAQVVQKPSGGGVAQGPSNSAIFGTPWARPQSWQQAPVPYRNPSGRRPQPPCRYGEERDAISMYGCR